MLTHAKIIKNNLILQVRFIEEVVKKIVLDICFSYFFSLFGKSKKLWEQGKETDQQEQVLLRNKKLKTRGENWQIMS